MANKVRKKWITAYECGYTYFKASPHYRPTELFKVIDAIHPDLKLETNSVYELVQSWIKRYKETWDRLTKERKALGKEFQWQDMEKYGIPWDASGWLIQALERERFASFQARTVSLALPMFSVLQVTWWWRIHLLAPDFTTMLCVAIGNEEEGTLATYRRIAPSKPQVAWEVRRMTMQSP
jgi:hypothetical protein